MKYIVTIDEEEYTIDINDEGHVTLNGERQDINFQGLDGTMVYSLILNGKSYDVDVNDNQETYQVSIRGVLYEVLVQDERTRRLAGLKGHAVASGEAQIKAPMPGVVVDVPVSEGETVSEGDIVVILESMKMQNEFKAPKDGTVHAVRVKAGDKVDQNAVMVTIA